MLTVTSGAGPLVSRMVGPKQLNALVAKLIAHSASFYVEPYPDDEWVVKVAVEHLSLMPRLQREPRSAA